MRSFIFSLISISIVLGCQEKYPALIENTDALKVSDQAPFYHGVASGDPTPQSVILWTRITPETRLPEVEVGWEVSESMDFASIVSSGSVVTNPDRDYTIKVDVQDLDAGSIYYYRFTAMDQVSPIGRTKTSPTGDQQVKFAVVSCSNYEFGYFNGYAAIAEEASLDAVLHLGDYIYEYGPGTYGDTTIGRTHIPAREIISLQDYRDRYAQYRLDPDLKAAHGKHPFILIWDDHEISNNSYKDGAQNHQSDEGDYETRKNAAVKAYYEWMPVRESGQLYRQFTFGDQVDLLMLDERLAGRTKPADSLQDPSLQDEERSMLGKEQLAWFEENMEGSTANWKVIGNQVIFSYLNWGHETFNINLDSWDGYPKEQDYIANMIKENGIENVVFVTGDTHSSWAFEVTHQPFEAYDAETGEGAYALEFGTTSINSGNSNERFPDEEVILHEQRISNSPINPHLKYTNMRDHGYLLVDFTREQVTATWKYVKTRSERTKELSSIYSVSAASGTNKLILPQE